MGILFYGETIPEVRGDQNKGRADVLKGTQD